MTRPDELKQAIEHAEACMADRDRWVAMLDVAVGSPYLRTLIDAAKQADAWREVLEKRTSYGEREAHSCVGHRLTESSWHVHLAGFCSRDDAEAALFALLPAPEPKGT